MLQLQGSIHIFMCLPGASDVIFTGKHLGWHNKVQLRPLFYNSLPNTTVFSMTETMWCYENHSSVKTTLLLRPFLFPFMKIVSEWDHCTRNAQGHIFCVRKLSYLLTKWLLYWLPWQCFQWAGSWQKCQGIIEIFSSYFCGRGTTTAKSCCFGTNLNK